MPLSIDITLPRAFEAVFPEKCIICHGPPDSKIGISTTSGSAFASFFLPFLSLIGRTKTAVPICKGCRLRFRFQRWGRKIACLAFIVIALFFIMPLFDGWTRLPKKAAVLGLCLATLVPWFAFEVFWPRVIETTVDGDELQYEFASEEYAQEFQYLNQELVLESDLPGAEVSE